MKVTSKRASFFHGRYFRPGEVFELPEGCRPSKAMVVVDEGKKDVKVEKKSGPSTARRRSRHEPVQTPDTLSEASALFDEEAPMA